MRSYTDLFWVASLGADFMAPWKSQLALYLYYQVDAGKSLSEVWALMDENYFLFVILKYVM